MYVFCVISDFRFVVTAALLWYFMQHRLVVCCRRFGTTYHFHLQGWPLKMELISLNMRPIGCPENSVTNHQSSLFVISEERRCQINTLLPVLILYQSLPDFVIFRDNFHLSVFSVSLPLLSPEFSRRCNNHSIYFVSTYCLFLLFLFSSDSLLLSVSLCWPLLQSVMIFHLYIYLLILHV
jgi:hypothetical protein